MIICNLDIIGITVNEPEADAPLVVDGDGVLSFPIPRQRVKPIARRNFKIIEARCQVDVFKLPFRPSRDIRCQSFRPAGRVQFLCVFVCERLDHPSSVNRHVTIVNSRETECV